MNYMDSKNRKGSITIEVAIVYTVLLIVLTMFVTAMNVQKTDMFMQAAIEQSSEDLSVIMPLTRITTEITNSVFDDEDIGESAKEAYKSLNKISSSFGELTGVKLEYLIANGLLSNRIKNDIAANFIERTDSFNHYTPDSIVVDFAYNEEKNVIEEVVTYSIRTIFGDISRTHYSVIPFYGVYDGIICDTSDIEINEEDNPWALSNFQRGSYFNELYGSNLPKTFPVIDYYEDGLARSIVSMDLTKESFSSSKYIEKNITTKLDAISSFKGADVIISGEKYTISEDEILSKELLIVIPENSPEDRCQILTNYIESYPNNDFNVTIVKYGNSV